MRKIYVSIILLCAQALRALARVAVCMLSFLFYSYSFCKALFVNIISAAYSQILNSVTVFFKANTAFVYNTNSTKNNTTLLPKNLHIDYVFFINK